MKNLVKSSVSTRIICLLIVFAVFAAPGTFAQNSNDINSTTSRYIRTKYMCVLSTQNGVKPFPKALDHFRMNYAHYGIADLYGDGTLDMMFGASDETFSIESVSKRKNPTWVYEGNRSRSRKAHQYSFYSPDPDFDVPNGTRYILARTIQTQDYNGDGVDDLAISNYGPDYRPFVHQSNEVLLSGPNGYKTSLLPGPKGLFHGGASGDIDNDGDVDIVVTGQATNSARLTIYENDGKGRFSIQKNFGIPSRSKSYGAVTVGLWDLNGDRELDLIVGGRSAEEAVLVFWGLKGLKFRKSPTIIGGEMFVSDKTMNDRVKKTFSMDAEAMDFEFADLDGDGRVELVILAMADRYNSWRLFSVAFNDTEIDRIVEIDRTDGSGVGNWLPWISACDLKNDGNIDLVYEHFGQSSHGNWINPYYLRQDWSRLDKIVWVNSGQGRFNRYHLEAKVFFKKYVHGFLSANAEFLGVSSEGYEPKQEYYPNNLNEAERFIHPYYEEIRKPEFKFPYHMVDEVSRGFDYVQIVGYNHLRYLGYPRPNAAESNSDHVVSDRVKKIIAKRKLLAKP
jgi:hypothetical protein